MSDAEEEVYRGTFGERLTPGIRPALCPLSTPALCPLPSRRSRCCGPACRASCRSSSRSSQAVVAHSHCSNCNCVVYIDTSMLWYTARRIHFCFTFPVLCPSNVALPRVRAASPHQLSATVVVLLSAAATTPARPLPLAQHFSPTAPCSGYCTTPTRQTCGYRCHRNHGPTRLARPNAWTRAK